MQELARQTERRYWPRGEHHAGAEAKVEALLNTFEVKIFFNLLQPEVTMSSIYVY